MPILKKSNLVLLRFQHFYDKISLFKFMAYGILFCYVTVGNMEGVFLGEFYELHVWETKNALV